MNGCANKFSLTGTLVVHNFPKKADQKEAWIRFCGRDGKWIPQKNQGVCSEHFEPACYDQVYLVRRDEINPKLVKRLIPRGNTVIL